MPNIIEGSGPDVVTLSSCKILDENAEPIAMYELWKRQTCIFVFLRHFACIGCRAHAVQVWENRQGYEKNGAKIIFIGNGSPQFIKTFKEDLKIHDAPVYTDPTLVSFRAAGFKRGFLAAMGVQAIANGTKLLFKTRVGTGYHKDAGDLWQIGGVLVIQSDGKVLFHFISEILGDYPPEKDVVS